MSPRLLCAALIATVALAQAPGPIADGSVSGVVKDSVTGAPLADYVVSTDLTVTWIGNSVLQSKNTRRVESVTDASGRFHLSGLPPGAYRIDARNSQNFGSSLTRRVTIAGRNLDNVDFRVVVGGTICGKVVDENKEPVPNISVVLVARELFHGVLGYFFKSITRTDDRGQYKLARVEAGQTYYVMAERREQGLAVHSEVPLDARLRRRAIMRTFYPNSPDKEGAAAISIRPRENREGVDIEVKKSPSYCIEGTTVTLNGPAAMAVQLDAFQPSMGMGNSGGLVGAAPNAATGPDGKFRFCDLYPGVFRLTASPAKNAPGDRALETTTIGNDDLKNVQIVARPLTINGETIFDGPAPVNATPPKALVSLQPLLRPANGEQVSGRADIPGTFTFSNLVAGEYGVRIFPLAAKGYYVKEITYAGRDALYGPINPATAPATAGLRIVVGQDGATITASVTDKDGNPVPQIKVLAIPADVMSDAMLQAALVDGETDQQGQYTTHYLAPGKYYVVATFDDVNPTPESIARLWRARARFYELDLAPNASATVNLKPVSLE